MSNKRYLLILIFLDLLYQLKDKRKIQHKCSEKDKKSTGIKNVFKIIKTQYFLITNVNIA